jgi:uncharacterized protein YdeI (YjbR/CyaY-like superfamily)
VTEITDTLTARDRDEWRDWLDENGERAQLVWLLLGKKGSGAASVTYDEAVEEALCFGWIDGQAKKWDDRRYAVRFTPRRPGSVWAESNKARIKKMITEGRMTERGLRLGEAAKANGDWDKLPAGEQLDVTPPALQDALAADPDARAAWNALPPGARRLYVLWITDAKREETRARRIAETVRRAKLGLRWGEPG